MEFKTESNFDPVTGLNMSSPIVGGMGYNPMPSTFSYNGDGVGRYTSITQPQNQYQQSSGFMNPPGGYVTSYNPYANMTGYNQYAYGNTGGIIYDSNLPITNQFYYQMGFQPTMDRYGNPVNPNQYGYSNSANAYYANAWQLYNQRREEELNYQQHYQQQQEIWKQLTILNRRNLGFDDGEEVYQQNIEAQQKFYATQYEIAAIDREYSALVQLSHLPTSADPGYVNPERQAYIEAWNKTYEQRSKAIPEGTTLYEFFNGGVANECWINMLKEEAVDRAKDMASLYSQEYFRNTLHNSNPNYDPITGTAGGKLTVNNMNRGLNIDDMEVTLPPHIANDEYAKKREKFMNTILSNMSTNLSDLSQKTFAKEVLTPHV